MLFSFLHTHICLPSRSIPSAPFLFPLRIILTNNNRDLRCPSTTSKYTYPTMQQPSAILDVSTKVVRYHKVKQIAYSLPCPFLTSLTHSFNFPSSSIHHIQLSTHSYSSLLSSRALGPRILHAYFPPSSQLISTNPYPHILTPTTSLSLPPPLNANKSTFFSNNGPVFPIMITPPYLSAYCDQCPEEDVDITSHTQLSMKRPSP